MNVSASGLTRFRKCPSSAVLPQVKTTSDAAEIGHHIHRYMELAAVGRKEEALRGLPVELRSRCEAIDVEAILSDYQSTEV